MHQPPARTDLHLTETRPLRQQLFTTEELGAAPEDKWHGSEAQVAFLAAGYEEKVVETEQRTQASQSHLFTWSVLDFFVTGSARNLEQITVDLENEKKKEILKKHTS